MSSPPPLRGRVAHIPADLAARQQSRSVLVAFGAAILLASLVGSAFNVLEPFVSDGSSTILGQAKGFALFTLGALAMGAVVATLLDKGPRAVQGVLGRGSSTLTRNQTLALKAWRQYVSVVRRWAPLLESQIPPPASDDEIAAAEAILGRPLPEFVTALYRLHNGSGPPTERCPWLLPIDRVASAWKFLDDFANEPHTPDERQPWDRNWLPIYDWGSGDYNCVDLSKGNVFELSHEHSDHREVAPSLFRYVAEPNEDVLVDTERGMMDGAPGNG